MMLKIANIAKVLFVIIVIIYIGYAYIFYDKFKTSINKSDFYYKITNQSISLKKLLEQNPSLYSKDVIHSRFQDYNEKTNELFIPSYGYFYYKYTLITNIDYLKQLKDVNSLVYELKYIPKNMNEILNTMPNLKSFSLISETKKDFNYQLSLKNLNVESFKAVLPKLENLELINTYKNLKDAHVTDLSIYDKLDATISSESLHTININGGDFDISEMVRYGTENYNRIHADNPTYEKSLSIFNDIIKEYTLKLYFDTKNLKNLYVTSYGPIILEFINNSGEINLDNFKISNALQPMVKSKNKIKVNNLVLDLNSYNNFTIEEHIECIDFSSIKKFSISGTKMYDPSYYTAFSKNYNDGNQDLIYDYDTNLKFLNKLPNLEELEIKLGTNFDFIENMDSLKTLYVEFQREETNLENLSKLKNLETLTLKSYTQRYLIKNADVLKNLKNLKTIVTNSRVAEQLPKLDGVNVNIVEWTE